MAFFVTDPHKVLGPPVLEHPLGTQPQPAHALPNERSRYDHSPTKRFGIHYQAHVRVACVLPPPSCAYCQAQGSQSFKACWPNSHTPTTCDTSSSLLPSWEAREHVVRSPEMVNSTPLSIGNMASGARGRVCVLNMQSAAEGGASMSSSCLSLSLALSFPISLTSIVHDPSFCLFLYFSPR